MRTFTSYYIGGYYELKVVGSTETETKYYSSPTGRFAMRVEGTLYWIFSDHLQSSSVILDEVGNVISRTDYTAFGEVRAETGTSPTDYTYTGQRSYLDSFRLHYYVARWYDPVTAHFAQADTIIPNPGNAGDWNRYAYVLYNPMRYIDPTGHYYVDDIIPGLTNDSSWWSYQNPNLQVRFVRPWYEPPNRPTFPEEYLDWINCIEGFRTPADCEPYLPGYVPPEEFFGIRMRALHEIDYVDLGIDIGGIVCDVVSWTGLLSGIGTVPSLIVQGGCSAVEISAVGKSLVDLGLGVPTGVVLTEAEYILKYADFVANRGRIVPYIGVPFNLVSIVTNVFEIR